MKKGSIALALVLFISFGIVKVQAAVKVGDKVEPFSLTDVKTGQATPVAKLAGPQGLAVIFISTECPYSNAFNKVMAAVADEYKSRGVAVVGINANSTEPANDVKQHAQSSGLNFAILKDDGAKIADRLGAKRTPEVFLFDKNMVLRYHGSIGNSKMPTTKAEEAKADDLKPALDAVISGKQVAVSETKAFGCTIKR